VESLTWMPVISDASLDSVEYITSLGSENEEKKKKTVKMSEQLRRRRLNR